MQPKHSAIVAGLTLALSFGAVAAPATAIAEEPTPGVASDATDIDKGLYTQQSFSGVLRSVQGVSFVNVTDEMKYFTKYESHGNYNQGFSYGDGYNALGYYQFDRRWSLIPFMKQVYNYDSAKYSMLKAAIDRGSEISNASNFISNASNFMYANGQLTELCRIAQEAFRGAYNTDPAEFSALQDAYAYNSYYAVTEAWLKSALGIDISGRADCVKGMVWSITNMCGTGGCQDFFRWANLSNDMTDREFVTALSNSVVDNVARKYSSQPQYHEGWKNRYKNELKDCLVYIAEDEAAAATPVEPDPEPEPAPTPASHPNKVPAAPAGPAGPTVETDSDTDNGGETGTPSTGAGNNGAGNGGTASGGTESAGGAGDSGSGSTGGSVSGSTGGSVSGSTGGGPSNGSTDVGEGSGTDSGSTDSGSSNGSTNVGKQLGALIGSSMTAGNNIGSSSDENTSGEAPESRTDGDADASTNAGARQSDADAQKGDDKNVTSTTTTTTTTTTTKASGGNMPKTGDLIVMASLASASLATLGATSIVSGKHKLDQQKKSAGEDGSEE